MNPALDRLCRAVAHILDVAPQVSDVLAAPGRKLLAEVSGQLAEAPTEALPGALTAAYTSELADALIGESTLRREEFARTGSTDVAFAPDERARFRVNIFRRRGETAVVMRRLPTSVPTMAELGLPAQLAPLPGEHHGLILVTGATGSGKSTTLAAVVEAINQTRPAHIVTLEDPVEFTFADKMGMVSQRELGTDFDSFASGLRAALRQAPKVILVGEMRDRETMEAALAAAETGHLVLSTLHTADAGATVTRLIGMFDPAEAGFVRQRLAGCLTWIVSQRLVPLAAGGRMPAFEILRNTLPVKELILTGETPEKTFTQVVAHGSPHGMITFDQYLLALFAAGKITAEAALTHATDRAELGRGVDAVKAAQGQQTSDIRGLGIDLKYGQKD